MALSLLVILLGVGIFQIFRSRIAGGEDYPQWSSLRRDPSGTRLLFDALAATGQVEIVRKYKDLNQEPEHNSSVLYLGFAPASLLQASGADLEKLEKAAQAGNRLVIAMDPGRWSSPPKEQPESALAKRWGVGVDVVPDSDKQDEAPTELFFSRIDGWTQKAGNRQKAGNNGRAVIVERAFGAGTIVLMASSGVFANRSLATDRDSSLLVKLIGSYRRIVFDEAHLGVQDTGSVLGLLHKYRLDGVLWGLIALALVFVWSHAAGFPPPEPAAARNVVGYDVRSGLAQLLRRQIPPSGVVEACVAEWKRTNAGSNLRSPLPGSDPIEDYRALQQELTHK